jgi:hypothetical protein
VEDSSNGRRLGGSFECIGNEVRFYLSILDFTAPSYSTTYTATLGAGIKDRAGNAMAISHTWTFTTEGPPRWPKQMGTSENDLAFGVATRVVNGYTDDVYVTGETFGGLDGYINAGDSDIFLVACNRDGSRAWTRQLGTGRSDRGQGVSVDSSGNIYVTGFTHGSLDGNTSAGDSDIFLVKYDSSGNRQWTRQLGTRLLDNAQALGVDNLGNVYVTGHTAGALDGNPNVGDYDIFLVKYDSSGVKQWTRQIGTPNWDEGEAVALDGLNNIYITGATAGSLHGNPNVGDKDIFLIKYDYSGNRQWTRQLGTSASEEGLGIAADEDGVLYVTGYTFGGLDGNTNAGGSDIFLVKYDSSGVKQWTRQIGTMSTEYAYGVAVDSSGNIYVTGYTFGGLDGNTNAGGSDIFLVKYDSSGVKQWTRQIGTTGSDDGHAVATSREGGETYLYVTGSTGGNLDGNVNEGGTDLLLIKYDSAGEMQ